MISTFLFNSISDVIFLLSLVWLIDGLGITNKTKNHLYSVLAVVITITLSGVMFWTYNCNITFIPVICYPLMIIAPLFVVFGSIKLAHIYISLVVEFSTAVLSSSLTLLIDRLGDLSYNRSDTISTILIRIIIFAGILIITKSERTKHVYEISKIIPRYVFVLILVMLICIDILAVFNNYPHDNEVKKKIFSILIVIITITLIVIISSLVVTVATNNYYLAQNVLLEKQVTTQISHYEKLEKLNSDMRTFRHDYINHLSSINALIGEGCYDDAQNYIEKLTESTHRNEAVFHTGNRLADAILTDKSDGCRDFADIEFEGCITDKIGNSDICIILSNALDNAAEACKKCPKRGKISIAAQIRQGYWTMTMKNPTVSEDSVGIMKTSKEDERNHGFGLLSIERAVKKYDGTMSVSIKDGVFELSVVMKITAE